MILGSQILKKSAARQSRCAASVSPRIVLGEGRAFVSLNFIIFDVRLYPRGVAKVFVESPPPLAALGVRLS